MAAQILSAANLPSDLLQESYLGNGKHAAHLPLMLGPRLK